MQLVRVWIDNPFFGSFERQDNAVFLSFDGEGDFYDAEEQTYLNYVTRWKALGEK